MPDKEPEGEAEPVLDPLAEEEGEPELEDVEDREAVRVDVRVAWADLLPAGLPVVAGVPVRVASEVREGELLPLEEDVGAGDRDGVAVQGAGGAAFTAPTYTDNVPTWVTADGGAAAQHPTKLPWEGWGGSGWGGVEKQWRTRADAPSHPPRDRY